MIPACQRLHAPDGAGVQVDDRLIVDYELLAFHGASELVLYLHAFEHPGVHARAEHLVAVLAAPLGRVHRQVSPAQDVLGPSLVKVLVGVFDRAAIGDTYAGAREDLSSTELERRLQALQDPCGNSLGFVTSGRRLEQHGELVPEETGYRISWSHA